MSKMATLTPFGGERAHGRLAEARGAAGDDGGDGVNRVSWFFAALLADDVSFGEPFSPAGAPAQKPSRSVKRLTEISRPRPRQKPDGDGDEEQQAGAAC